MLKATLTNSNDEEIETDFFPSSTTGEQFTVALPNLSANTYTLKWVVLGSDSHRVEGDISFILSATAQETNGGDEVENHTEHHAE